MTQDSVQFGPRLVAHPTGALRAVILATASRAIENARPLPGEPNAVASRALSELEVLIKTLRYIGCEVFTIVAPSKDPYACALADTAIMLENGAVMMRPAALGRRCEVAELEAEFDRRGIPIAAHIAAPGLIDGRDVLMAGDCAFIARSPRNNELGRASFAEIATAHGFRAVEVPLLDGAAALRAVAGVIANDTIVCAGDRVDAAAFDGFKTIGVDADDALGAGVLNLGERHVLADVRYPRCIGRLRAAGTLVEAIDLYDYGRVGITPSMLALELKRL